VHISMANTYMLRLQQQHWTTIGLKKERDWTQKKRALGHSTNHAMCVGRLPRTTVVAGTLPPK
jgi:hypothetical protein